MSHYYPILLRLEGKRCLIVGNGFGADEKAQSLTDAGADVTRQPAFQEGDLEGYFLVVAATGDSTLNGRIWREAERLNILVNAVDDPRHCSFILPAVHRQGDLVVAVSSSGRSPALATRLRDRFASEMGPEYAQFAEMLGELRPAVAARCGDFEQRRRLWYRLVDSEALPFLRQSRQEDARRVLAEMIERNEL